MKIKVTKVFAKFVDKFVKETGLAECAEFQYVHSIDYPGGTWAENGDLDYDDIEDKFRVIKVFYPYEYYSPACIISTPLLMRMCKGNESINEDELKEILREIIEI